MSTGIISTIVVSVLGAISIRVMTTQLGASAFGIFVLVQSYVSLVQTFTDLGLAQVLQRDIALGDQDERSLLSHAMGLRVTLSLIAVPAAAAVGLLVYSGRSSTMKVGLLLMLCAIPFAVSQEVSAAYFSAKLRNKVLAVGSISSQIVFVGLVILSVSLNKSIVYCLGAALVSAILSSAYANIMARREIPFSPTFNRSIWYSMLRTSSPIGVAYIVGLLYFRADTLILSFLSTSRQIGFYGAAYSIVSVFLVLPGIFTRAFLPSMVRASKETLESSIHSALAYFSIGGTLSAAGIVTCGPTIVKIIAGSHFGPSDTPLRVLGIGLIFIFVATALSSVCVARGFGNKIFVMSVVSLTLNVALNVVAIPRFGITGAAFATLCCEVISLALFTHLVRREIKVRIRVVHSLFRPCAAGLVACAVLAPIYLRSDLRVAYGLALIPATFFVYFTTLTAIRGLPMELLSSIKPSLGKLLRRRGTRT